LSSQDAPDGEHKRGFYRAVIICCDAVRDLAERYAALAEELAATAGDPARAVDLHTIAEVCRRVPENPASSFHEAIQSLVFYHIALHNVHFDAALGRLDQFFYPFLRNDLDRGAITFEEAQELIDCFVLKINDCAWHGSLTGDKVREIFGGPVRRGLFHNAVLGGQTPDGRDATNDVTYMLLDSLRRLATIFPTVSVRLHSGSPEKLIGACCEVLRTGAGAPALYNDDVFIPALVKAGIPIDDARDFANDGCWEVTIGGKTGFSYRNFCPLKCLEWVLTRGRGLPVDWKRILGWKAEEDFGLVPASDLSVGCPEGLESPAGVLLADRTLVSRRQHWHGRAEPLDTGDPCAFDSFEELMSALEAQIEHQIRKLMADYVAELGKDTWIAPNPLCSTLLQDCVDIGRDFCDGGVRYDLRGVNAPTIANTADSLCAIRKFVFEDGILSMAQMIHMLQNNYEGDEDIRAMLVSRAPKYGNDDEAADAMAARLLNFVGDTVERVSREMTVPEGYHLVWGHLSGTFELATRYGGWAGATPDGRHASEPVAVNLSPSIGMAMKGPTAVLRSYTRLPLDRLRTGAPLDLRVDGSTLAGEAGLSRLIGFVRSFIELGGGLMTISVVDADTMRRAQKEPSKYRHLRVRLGGSQAYFVGLSREQQDFQIMRAEHSLG
jgi:formate C-acetyltransferase